MGDLIDTIQTIVKNYIENLGLADVVIGTVTQLDPLEVTLENSTLPIPEESLMLTETVAERKIRISGHSHQISTLSHVHTTEDADTSEYAHTHDILEMQTEKYEHKHDINVETNAGVILDKETLIVKALKSGEDHEHDVSIVTTSGVEINKNTHKIKTSKDEHAHKISQHSTVKNEHTHVYPGRTTSDELTDSYATETASENISSGNGNAAMDESGYLTLNYALAVGDKLIMLRVLNGQKFIILSRTDQKGAI